MKNRNFIAVVFLFWFYGWAYAADYALISKSLDDANFQDTAAGCNEAASINGDRCIHIGPKGSADPRIQTALLKRAARSEKYSGFAVSVVLSGEVAKVIRREVSAPVIAFDSPFSSEDGDVSLAYVGTDNIAFGRDLARIAKKFRPEGGGLFLMGDLHDSNLVQRMAGIRRELSGDETSSHRLVLSGQGGWREFARSPWLTGDDIVRSLDQVSLMLETIKPDVFISAGHWPVVKPDAYRKAVEPFRGDLVSAKTLMVFGVGKITPGLQKLLDDRLVHGLISIDFFEIGRKVYQTLRMISQGRSVPARSYIPNLIRTAD